MNLQLTMLCRRFGWSLPDRRRCFGLCQWLGIFMQGFVKELTKTALMPSKTRRPNQQWMPLLFIVLFVFVLKELESCPCDCRGLDYATVNSGMVRSIQQPPCWKLFFIFSMASVRPSWNTPCFCSICNWNYVFCSDFCSFSAVERALEAQVTPTSIVNLNWICHTETKQDGHSLPVLTYLQTSTICSKNMKWVRYMSVDTSDWPLDEPFPQASNRTEAKLGHGNKWFKWLAALVALRPVKFTGTS